IETVKPLQVTMRRVDKLTLYEQNARTHSPKQIRQIVDSIEELGFLEPILVDAKGVTIAGHGRVKAAELLGMVAVPTICIDHLKPAQVKAYRITTNRLAELAGWDEDILRIEFGDLIECDFDVEITGFDTADIDVLFQDPDDPDSDPAADQLPETDPAQPPVTQTGDLWMLDSHHLLCGDATTETAFEALMAGQLAQMVITDAPYNLAIDGNVCGSGAIKHDEFIMASGEMSKEEYTVFKGTTIGHLVAYSIDGSIHYLFMDWRHLPELYAAALPHYGRPKNLIVWNKDNAGMGTFYRSKHELIPVFKNGTAKHINNFELGQKGRYRSNVWNYPGQNSFHKGRLEELAMHPTVKPVALIADASIPHR
ncbi:MAG: site-specific DNA-methyltransferase, partial [Alphaproteobacteria bacterium]|nr:site-specific DNA-methyltransferase [Alphaproteobacteria bacterium]